MCSCRVVIHFVRKQWIDDLKFLVCFEIWCEDRSNQQEREIYRLLYDYILYDQMSGRWQLFDNRLKKKTEFS